MGSIKLTTTNISVDHLKYLKKLAEKNGLKQVEFINAMVDFFRKTGVNPVEEISSPREEIQKLTKRVDEVIRFMQYHEKNKLSPLFERMLLLDKQLKDTYSKVVTADDLKPLIDQITALNDKFKKVQIRPNPPQPIS